MTTPTHTTPRDADAVLGLLYAASEDLLDALARADASRAREAFVRLRALEEAHAYDVAALERLYAQAARLPSPD